MQWDFVSVRDDKTKAAGLNLELGVCPQNQKLSGLLSICPSEVPLSTSCFVHGHCAVADPVVDHTPYRCTG